MQKLDDFSHADFSPVSDVLRRCFEREFYKMRQHFKQIEEEHTSLLAEVTRLRLDIQKLNTHQWDKEDDF